MTFLQSATDPAVPPPRRRRVPVGGLHKSAAALNDWVYMQPDAPGTTARVSGPRYGVDRTIGCFLGEWRRFLFGFVPILGLGLLYLWYAPRQYTAEVTVMAAARETDIAGTDSVAPATAVREPDIDGELQLMTAPAALRRVAHSLHLDSPTSGTRVTATTTSSEDERVSGATTDRIARNLKVAPVGRSTIVKIQFTDSSPELAASVANAIAENYIDVRYRNRLEIAERAADYLHRRTAELQADVARSDRKLADFRAGSQARGRDLGQLKSELNALNERIVIANTEREKAASRLSVAEERVRKNGLVALLAWEAPPGTNPYLDRLRGALAALKIRGAASEIGQESRGLEAQLEAAAQTILQGMRMNLDAATRQVQAMEESLQKVRQEVNAVEGDGVQLNALQSEAAASRAVYENVVNRWKATEQVGFNEARSWIVSRAGVPLHPSSPKMVLVLIASIVAAVGVGLSNVLFKEYRARRTIRSLDDIETHLGPVRVLGAIPELRRSACHVSEIVNASAGAEPMLAEAVAGLYTSLSSALDGGGSTAAGQIAGPAMVGFGQVVLVSSATSQEGKSATTASLAAAAYAAGKQVLVVDCDLRAPTLHTAFNLALTPGVAECVDGTVEWSAALQYHPETGVWLLSAGNTDEAPQKLLHSAAMARLLSQLRDSFDLVLLDAPPVLAVSDVRTLAPVADHTILIVAWSRTEWAASKLALRMLQEAGAQIVGAVLSRVDVSRMGSFELPEAQIYRKPYSKYRRATRPSPRCYAEAEA